MRTRCVGHDTVLMKTRVVTPHIASGTPAGSSPWGCPAVSTVIGRSWQKRSEALARVGLLRSSMKAVLAAFTVLLVGGSLPAAAAADGGTVCPSIVTWPAVSGDVFVGASLTLNGGSWNPSSSTLTNSWEYSPDGGTTWDEIQGSQNATTYALTSAYAGDQIRAKVLASTGSCLVVTYAQASAPVQYISNTMPPVISGDGLAGDVVTSTTGTWDDAQNGDDVSYSFQWQRSTDNGVSWQPIAGATTAAYTPTSADVGTEVSLAVTAMIGSGQSAQANSQPMAISPQPLSISVKAPMIAEQYWAQNASSIWHDFTNGQCTQWAAYQRPDIVQDGIEAEVAQEVNQGATVIGWGNWSAYNWPHWARLAGFEIGTRPQAGALMVLQPGVLGAGRVSGHIAYVVRVFRNGSILISQMHAPNLGAVTYATFTAVQARARGVSYIYRMPEGWQPTI